MREKKLPLRTVLENFINHVGTLEAKKGEKDEQYEQEFQELKKLTEGLKNDVNFCCIEGEKECNRRKNRYKDILPYDRTRVVVRPYPGIPGSDYINANYIRGASGSRAYIASQGPLPHTVADFWRMVVECDVQVIIMASNETEGGKHKCECYWVETPDEEKQFGNVTVTFVKSRQVCPDFLVKTFKIKFTTEKNKTEERTICQFHYILWPDHGVPDTVRPLLDMVRLVRDCQASETLPVLVHCSAGCGRTGTICAIDYVWGLLRTGKLTDNLDLFGLVKEMRRQRVAMVQTKEQYILLHQAVKELFRERLKLIDSHPYENVATDGNPIILNEKESDYEELYVTQEKQDTSTKTSTPTPTQSIASTPSNSLSRQRAHISNRAKEERDYLRRSASTSSLDCPYFPPVPIKPSKPAGSMSLALSQSSLPGIPGTGSLKNSPVAYSSISSSPCFTSYLSDSDLNSSRKRPPSGYSKMEKDAENIAQKLESRERERKTYSSSLCGLSQRSSATSSPANTSFSSPSMTPVATPMSNTPNPLQSVGLLATPSPPAPPPRSRTPSPIISLRKSFELHQQNGSKRHNNQLDVPRSNGEHSPDMRRKSTELVRRPSIQKLKELFEKSGANDGPGHIRLSRSASSITAKTNLSVPGCEDSQSSRIRRKGSLGSEENLLSKKLYESESNRLQICPPPPPLKEVNRIASLGKPPSSPATTSPTTRRRGMVFSPDNVDGKSKALSRLDDRPALPVKKSKSFRWSRQDNCSPPIKSCTSRSPDLPKKKFDDINYYSLERNKTEHSFNSAKTDLSNKKHVEDFPSPKEGFKLSVYQVASKNTPESLAAKCDDKPFIPPKRVIGERYKNIKITPIQLPSLQPLAHLGETDPSVFDGGFPSNAHPAVTDSLYDQLPVHKAKKVKDSSQRYYHESVPDVKELKQAAHSSEPLSFTSKEYVNARLIKSTHDDSHSPKFIYVPVPSKRNVKDKDRHDYANYDIGIKYDVKVCKNQKGEAVDSPSKSETSELSKGTFPSYRSSERGSSSDYEPMDFGERATSVDEVFETVNYELLHSKEKNKKSDKKEYSSKEFYLNRDLDYLARQVYQDCQDYLLHGTNRSPVPSLMPKNKEPEEASASSSSAQPPNKNYNSIADRLLESLADLEEVKNKVSVPPHGLRNRERRDSYRQAVSPNSINYSKFFGSHGHPLPRKNIHKYEKIWFDTPRHEERYIGPLTSSKRPRGGHQDNQQFVQDFSSNLDQEMNINGKEDLFKDKLKELQNLVSHLEQKKGMFLPDLSEEDLSSRDSGSTSSLLSKSGHSSKSSEKNEPIYANATTITVSPLGPPTRNRVDQLVDSHSKSSVIATPISPYGTIATATHPFKPKLTNSTHSFATTCASNSLPSNYQKNHTSTLPSRPIPSLEVSTLGSPGKTHSVRPSVSSKHLHPHGGRHHSEKMPHKNSASPTASSGTSDINNVASHRKSESSPHHSGKSQASKSPYKKLPSSSYIKSSNSSSNSGRKKPDSSRSRIIVGDTAMIGTSNLEKTNIASISARKNESEMTKSAIEPPLGRDVPPSSNLKNSKFPSPYLQPPPPKPLLNNANSTKFYVSREPLGVDKSATTTLTQDSAFKSNSMTNGIPLGNSKATTVHERHASNHLSNSDSPTIAVSPSVPLDTSTTDTSDDEEGIFHKLSPGFWSKFIGNSNKTRDGQKSPSIPPKYPPEDRRPSGEISSPAGSPKPFSKTLGKFKFGTKVSNLKSYLKGDRVGAEDGQVGQVSRFHQRHQPLQKSASSGPSVGAFTHVVNEYKYPSSIPKKPFGPKEMPISLSPPEHPQNPVNRPRQQYL